VTYLPDPLAGSLVLNYVSLTGRPTGALRATAARFTCASDNKHRKIFMKAALLLPYFSLFRRWRTRSECSIRTSTFEWRDIGARIRSTAEGDPPDRDPVAGS